MNLKDSHDVQLGQPGIGQAQEYEESMGTQNHKRRNAYMSSEIIAPLDICHERLQCWAGHQGYTQILQWIDDIHKNHAESKPTNYATGRSVRQVKRFIEKQLALKESGQPFQLPEHARIAALRACHPKNEMNQSIEAGLVALGAWFLASPAPLPFAIDGTGLAHVTEHFDKQLTKVIKDVMKLADRIGDLENQVQGQSARVGSDASHTLGSATPTGLARQAPATDS
ncbi:hypothetical protein VTJ04DRAFT_10415 [Mycothermus thermophilus]|uniref:uncharacterized protein n=1 Tax=Humicola insolens TaxID=85995 RepID=UPI00374434B1